MAERYKTSRRFRMDQFDHKHGRSTVETTTGGPTTYIDRRERKHLPLGCWVHLSNLPEGSTEEDVVSFLDVAGIKVTVDMVAVNISSNGAFWAVVSMPNDEIVELMTRAIGPNLMGGKEVKVMLPKSKIGH
jgi:hypothetical protein